MSRPLTVAAAQLGPIARDELRSAVVKRMLVLMQEAHEKDVDLVVFPELALTTFFPRWYFEDQADIDAFFETEMPGPETQALFDKAKELQIGFYLGYAELIRDPAGDRHFNTAILVDKSGESSASIARSICPATRRMKHGVHSSISNVAILKPAIWALEPMRALAARWACACVMTVAGPRPSACSVSRGAELVMIGYNTPLHYPPAPEHDHLQDFHNHLPMQAGAYQNGTWVVGVAKAGKEEGCDLIGKSCIIAPTGEVVAVAETLGDELITHVCDLDRCDEIRKNVFDFAAIASRKITRQSQRRKKNDFCFQTRNCRRSCVEIGPQFVSRA